MLCSPLVFGSECASSKRLAEVCAHVLSGPAAGRSREVKVRQKVWQRSVTEQGH